MLQPPPYEPLTREEETRLAPLAAAGDLAARDALVRSISRIVIRNAVRATKTTRWGRLLDPNDAAQEAYLAAQVAATRYAAKAGAMRFGTFYHWHMVNGLRDLSRRSILTPCPKAAFDERLFGGRARDKPWGAAAARLPLNWGAVDAAWTAPAAPTHEADDRDLALAAESVMTGPHELETWREVVRCHLGREKAAEMRAAAQRVCGCEDGVAKQTLRRVLRKAHDFARRTA